MPPCQSDLLKLVVCPLADSYVAVAAREAGSVVELQLIESPPSTTDLDTRCSFQPVAIETLGPINNLLVTFCQTWSQDFSSVRH